MRHTPEYDQHCAQLARARGEQERKVSNGDAPACLTCSWWRHQNAEGGLCHGVPPSTAGKGAPFPFTAFSDFCPLWTDDKMAAR